METFLIKAAQLILAFVILVTIHEFGHYIFARIFGMRVSKFYLFFNPWFSLLKYNPRANTLQLVGWTKQVLKPGAKGYVETSEDVRLLGIKLYTRIRRERIADDFTTEQCALKTIRLGKPHPVENPDKPTWRDTLYGLGWLPLGGYCAIDGMIDETTDASQLAKEPEPWEFRAKKPFPRLLVMMAGVIMNFVLAIIIYIGMAMYWGDRSIPFDQVSEGWDFAPELQASGLKNGDMPIAINGERIDNTDDLVLWKFIQDGNVITAVRNHTDTVNVTIPEGTTLKYADPDHKRMPMALRLPVVVSKLSPGEGAERAGIALGDRIVKLGNDTTPSYTELLASLETNAGKTVDVTVLRDGKEKVMPVEVNGDGKLGIGLTPPDEIYPFDRVNYGFIESIPVGITRGVEKLTTYVSSLKMLFTKQGAQSVGGFGAIGDMFPEKWNWESFWSLTAFLSVILAFMNILPIPALDGGHVMFTLYEIITRRKPSEKFLGYAQTAGMLFLLLLLVYANFNDIYRFFIK